MQKAFPVLESGDIKRDAQWYSDQLGFEVLFQDDHYAVLRHGAASIHLQWHAGTEQDPLNGGAVVRFLLEDVGPYFTNLKSKGLVEDAQLKEKTPWNTTEFALFDANKNALIFTQDLSK